MSKRHLSEQQQGRIKRRQKSSAHQSGQTGVVIAHYGKEVDIAPFNESNRVDLNARCRCHFRANLPTLVCGDKVHYQPAKKHKRGIVESILPRETLIERPRPYQDPKPVAANIDTIVLVIGPEPEPISGLIDRYLIAAENARLDIILLVNKSDLLFSLPADNKIRTEIEQLRALYSHLGYKVYFGSSRDNSLKTMEAATSENGSSDCSLGDLFSHRNSILVGQSGIGKSSIINAVAPDSQAEVGEMSDATVKGKHTTTTSQLYFLSDNERSLDSGMIIDSPGIREFGLWHLSKQAIINGMPELRELSLQCKFRDCDHDQSEGCALLTAIDNNNVHPSRIASYRQILDTLQTSD